jgi:Sulfotransferase family
MATTVAEPIRLVYVASTGRSGSTLLEMLLGAQHPVATMGELHLWPHEIARTGRTLPCGCGMQVTDCPFWKSMRQRVDPLAQPAPRMDRFRESHNAGRTLRPGKLPGFIATRHPRDAQAIAIYGANNDEVFRAFAETFAEFERVKPCWLVDASKDPYRLLWLIESGLFEITVLHVTKDPRAYVFSQGKRLWLNPSQSREIVARRISVAARNSLGWMVVNELIATAARRHLSPAQYLHVRYEDLAASPETVMDKVGAAIGCPIEPDAIPDFRQRQTHSMAGNPTRHKTSPIELDEKWRHGLPGYAQRLVSSLTVPMRPRMGY